MARKIKAPLKMGDGTSVRTIEELREHFDMESIIAYFLDGRLERWLDDHYEKAAAAAIHALQETEDNLPAKLCAILSIELSSNEDIDIAAIVKTIAKKKRLRTMTQDETIFAHARQTAFTQDDLQELLTAGETTIYLCGKSFSISAGHDNMTYIGILGTPITDIGTASAADLQTHHIVFQNTQIKSKAASPLLPNLPNHKKVLNYSGTSFLHALSSSPLDTAQARELFKCLTAKLQLVAFDVDASSRPLLNIIHTKHQNFDVDASSRPLLDVIKSHHNG
ncbi:hypothetical protein [Mitsuokella jalaludinii]|uniref:Uncharacterized protein n=1 Tax=Mitsuokella jalaludinii TaxID=187979 RepID=A0A173ZL10_9FIRM|nr:hypothetical protein [Mitsuokella jalaludinii]CUN75908.1 Uncharacterised protein [Mitsuokella jalaludinii]